MTSTRTTITNNEEAKGSLIHCFGRCIEIILEQLQLLVYMFRPHVFVITNSYCCFF